MFSRSLSLFSFGVGLNSRCQPRTGEFVVQFVYHNLNIGNMQREKMKSFIEWERKQKEFWRQKNQIPMWCKLLLHFHAKHTYEDMAFIKSFSHLGSTNFLEYLCWWNLVYVSVFFFNSSNVLSNYFSADAIWYCVIWNKLPSSIINFQQIKLQRL